MSNVHRVAKGEKNANLFCKMEGSDGIWEFRTKYNGMIYIIFSLWDTEEKALIVGTHGIVKKTQKTPKKEIHKAEKIKEIYFKTKEQEK